MFKSLVEFLEQNYLRIEDCRGQSYDNASSMSGTYNGPITDTTGLVVKTAAECCPAALSFFSLLEEVYVFFTASTHRYEILMDKFSASETPLYISKKYSET